MKKDITTKVDTDQLVNIFYSRLEEDKILAPYFSGIADRDHFLATLKLFWENVVFFTGSYNGNPMEMHRSVHQINPLSKKLFQRWTRLFNKTVDELFEGEKADLVKQRAKSIATVMQVKILNSEK